MMENEVLNASSPLYGRRTGQWKLEPLKLKDIAEFFRKHGLIGLIEIYKRDRRRALLLLISSIIQSP